MLGVCLGHQALAEAYGGVVTHAEQLMHGKTSEVLHHGTSVFAGLPSPVTATRYHSLSAVRETIPEVLEITAETADGVIMGLAHKHAPLCGVQFHPESVLTQGGYLMLGNWLESLGLGGCRRDGCNLEPAHQQLGMPRGRVRPGSGSKALRLVFRWCRITGFQRVLLGLLLACCSVLVSPVREPWPR